MKGYIIILMLVIIWMREKKICEGITTTKVVGVSNTSTYETVKCTIDGVEREGEACESTETEQGGFWDDFC